MAIARQRFVGIEFAEAAAEGDVLLARDLLVAEQQDAALEEGAVDLVEFGVAERLGEIDALDLGAERVGSSLTETGMHPCGFAANGAPRLTSVKIDGLRSRYLRNGAAAAAPHARQSS